MDALPYLTTAKIITASGKINANANKLINNNIHLKEFIESNTIFIGAKSGVTYRERIHCLINNITALPACSTCNGDVKFVGGQYQQFCSIKCANTNEKTKQARRDTNNVKYGGNAPLCDDTVKQKVRGTMLNKYGVEYHQQSAGGRAARQQTCSDRYGADSPFQSADIQAKVRSSITDTYGNHNYNQSLIPSGSLDILTDRGRLLAMHHDDKMTIYQIANQLNVSTFCVKSHMELNNIEIIRFPHSAIERDVVEFVQSITDYDVISNTRSVIAPYELDCFIPDANVAIEVNGIYWHGELTGKSRAYHIGKYNACLDQGIRLVQLTDKQWIETPELVKSRLRSIFGRTTNKLHARKCNVVIPTVDQVRRFQTETHIQKYVGFSVALALEYQGNIVSVLTMGKPRYSSAHQWELLRLSSSLDHTIVGGASKLFSHFVKHYCPTDVISYSDASWNTGNVYDRLGFEFIRQSKPSYQYFHRSRAHKLYHRSQFQKHKLAKLIATFDPSLTEWENMRANGYDRIWDSGNSVWQWVA